MANCPIEHQALCIDPPTPVAEASPIFRVPLPLRSIAPSMFTPQVVPVGPFHRTRYMNLPLKSDFEEIERVKWVAVQLMSQDLCFCEVVEFLRENERKILGFYEGRLETYETALKTLNLAHMIALDAFFTTAVLHSFFEENYPQLRDKLDPEETLFLSRNRFDARFQSIYSSKLSRPVRKAIIQDLLLVENQIPLFAVKQVIKMDRRCKAEGVAGRLLEFYVAALAHRILPFNKSRKNVLARVKGLGDEGEHLLDCIYMIVCSNADDTLIHPYPEEIAGAKNLHRSGVTLHGHKGSLGELSFNKGRFFIPRIHVGDDTERIFRNLIAYESCYKLNRVDVLSYLHFMDYLVDNQEDVELLIEKRIIIEHIGSTQKVAEMWNGLCRNTVPVFSHKYFVATEEATKYCNSSWNRLWVEFYRKYLHKPWVVASVTSAAAFFIMTFVIMLYTLLLYIHIS